MRRKRRASLPPVEIPEAEIEITQHDRDRDLAETKRHRREISGFCLEGSQRKAGLGVEVGDPPGRMLLDRLVPLVAPEHEKIHQAIGQRVLAQHLPARFARGRNQLPPHECIQKINDRKGIDQHRAVIEHQRRDLAERINRQHRRIDLLHPDRHGNNPDPLREVQFMDGNKCLADEGGARGPVEFHRALVRNNRLRTLDLLAPEHDAKIAITLDFRRDLTVVFLEKCPGLMRLKGGHLHDQQPAKSAARQTNSLMMPEPDGLKGRAKPTPQDE